MIKKKRIRKLNPYKKLLPTTDEAFVTFSGATTANLERAGFSDDAEEGAKILPNRVGRISLFNAEGKNRIRRDMPMKTAHRTVEWHWYERHGRDKVERSDFRDVPYKRYPREFIEPPAIELTLSTDTDGNVILISDPIKGWQKNEALLIHAINLFLELFGECIILDENRLTVLPSNIKRVNWKLLPKGERPFERLKQELRPILASIKRGKRSFVDKRLELLNRFNPEYAAIGIGGFSGYILMAYPDKNLFVLESLLYGNATYVVSKNWEEIASLTKAEILRDNLHEGRIIHQSNWFSKVHDLFKD